MAYQITNQKDLRRAFWNAFPEASRKRNRDGDYLTDTRVLWVDYVDAHCRGGTISKALADRATLE